MISQPGPESRSDGLQGPPDGLSAFFERQGERYSGRKRSDKLKRLRYREGTQLSREERCHRRQQDYQDETDNLRRFLAGRGGYAPVANEERADD